MTDPNHCGACGSRCLPGEVCTGGVCDGCQGGVGEVQCGTLCIDPNTNPTYCGASGDCQGADQGVTCAQGYVCLNGKCTLVCGPDSVPCDGQCVSPGAAADAGCGDAGP
jgi:hypothetical protein